MDPLDVPSSDEKLYELWMTYMSKGDASHLYKYIDSFIDNYTEYVDADFTHLNDGYMPEGPHLTKLPEGLIPALLHQLSDITKHLTLSLQELFTSEKLLQCLIIICRNLDNVEFVSSCEFISHVVTIATAVTNKLCSENSENVDAFIRYLSLTLHLFECLYDPYFIWRKKLRGWRVDKNRLKYKPGQLHVEVVPFFYECFQKSCLGVDIQTRLFHVFGAVIAGSQSNALKAICPATLDVVLGALAGTNIQSGPLTSQRDDIVKLRDIVLECVVRMVHVLHTSNPEERQVEVGLVLEGYFHVLLQLESTGINVSLQLRMLNASHAMVDCGDKESLQLVFIVEGVFDTLVKFLQSIMVTGMDAQLLGIAVVRVMTTVMSGSQSAKEKFLERVGYRGFLKALLSLGQPFQDLIESVFDLVVERQFDKQRLQPIRNCKAAIMLVDWLPEIESLDLQMWLTDNLKVLCMENGHNRMLCCAMGMLEAIISVLHHERKLSPKAADDLIYLLENLGSWSISSHELKQLLRLLCAREDGSTVCYRQQLMASMAHMATSSERETPRYFLDFHEEHSGIVSHKLGKWLGAGFTFHGWVCIDNSAPVIMDYGSLVRRQLYSLSTSSGAGFEAFFTSDAMLVIAVIHKKEYHAVQVNDAPFLDNHWHCIDVVHASAKNPFSQSQLTVYVDGKMSLSAQLKFPSTANEDIQFCVIGHPEHRSEKSSSESQAPSKSEPSQSRLRSVSGVFSKLIPEGGLKGMYSKSQSSSVVSLSLGVQDEHFGAPVSIVGQVASAVIYQEALSENTVSSLYSLGPNLWQHSMTEERVQADASNRLTLLHFNAKASTGSALMDLSSNCHHGKICKATKYTLFNVKEVINCIGGVQVLFPLLEQLSSAKQDAPLTTVTVGVTQGVSQQSPTSPESPSWELIESYSKQDALIEDNQVAGFLSLLRNMIQSSTVNQETLAREVAMATLGVLLQKVASSYLDNNVHSAIKMLVEAVSSSNRTLLLHIYQYILFDFRIWSKCEFDVAVGHVQYLSTLIKEEKKHFRKSHGVQYMLDVIRTYYSSSPDKCALTQEQSCSIRGALISLVKYYISREINIDELNHIVGFIVSVKEEALVCELIDMLISLLEQPGKRDQIYLLLYEPRQGELLHVLLTKKDFSVHLREKVIKVLTLLLKTDRVYEKNKTQMRLLDAGMFAGLTSLMSELEMSVYMVQHMMEQVLMTDTAAGIDAVLYITQLLHFAEIDVKLRATKQLMMAIFSKPTSPKIFAKQQGWQEILVRLFIERPKSRDEMHGSSSTPVSPQPSQNNMSLLDLPTNQNLSVNIMKPESVVKKQNSFDSSELNAGRPARPSFLQSPDSDTHPSLDIPSPMATESSSHMSRFVLPSDPGYFDPYYAGDSSRSSTVSRDDLLDADGNKLEGSLTSSLSSYSLGGAGDIVTTPMTEEIPEGTNINAMLEQMGVAVNQVHTEGDELSEKTEELCQNLLILIFTVMWKGVEGSDKTAWKERGQVLQALEYTSQHNYMLSAVSDLRKRTLEMLLQGCIMDLKETGLTNTATLENAIQLIKLFYFYLCVEEEQELFTERILEDILSLLDLLTVWDPDNGWMEMEQLGLNILMAFASNSKLECCSLAAARVHTLLQTRPVEKLQESCFIMGSFDAILISSLKEHPDHYSFLHPVMKSLIEKCKDLLNMTTYLPHLPDSQSPHFFDEFQRYCVQDEWRNFMSRQVIPSMEQYDANIFESVRVELRSYMAECQEDMMVAGHMRARDRGQSKLKFQDVMCSSFERRARMDEWRYNSVRTQLRQQHKHALRQWRSTRAFFTGERGTWAESRAPTGVQYWKLSNLENLSRMRPKLIPNYSYDSHLDASRLRDNQGVEQQSQDLLSLTIAKEAKVSEQDIGDDRLGDEEWNLISTTPSQGEEEVKVKLSVDCQLVTIMDVARGQLEVTNTHVYFLDCSPNKEEGQDFKFSLSQLREIHFRRYNLRRSALEFFLVDQSNYFLNFQKKDRNKVYSHIARLRPPNLIYSTTRSPADLLKASDLTKKWVHREISNFDYLMNLNTIAGRTYNDLSQYPVFPWVLSDFESDTLDLENPAVYRDLSKPIGVVNPNNEEEVREKYEHFEDPAGTIPKFHYGTHYSNPAAVMHFLVRMEPFATLHIQLQSGRFDVADRQFHSIPATWHIQTENTNDVKELIPEFFYLPEFLENHNDLDLGELQVTKEKIDNVILPKWATSPHDFINKHRKALESEHVSGHLHEWIDLVFGFKQRGAAAVDALNVFFYCSYEGAVDLDAVSDPVKQKALEGMINNFGQTPTQLLKEPHPRRLNFEEAVTKAGKSERPMSVLFFLNEMATFFVEGALPEDPLTFVCVPRSQIRSFMQSGTPDTMLAVTENGLLWQHSWLPYNRSISHFYTFDKDPVMSSLKNLRRLAGPFTPGLKVTSKLFTVTHDARLLFSGGHWDNSLRVWSIVKSKTVSQIVRHNDVVTCVALDNCGKHLITGSRDTTCIIWQIQHDKYGQSQMLDTLPLQVLYGHEQEVTTVAISIELDMAVSGSSDGSVVLHTVRKGTYIRTLRPPHEKGWQLSVQQLSISDLGHIAVYCQHTTTEPVPNERMTLHLYSINGKHLSMEPIHVPITDMLTTQSHLIFGNRQGVLIFKELIGLKTITSLPLHVPITCVSVTSGNSHVLVGLRDGNLIVVGIKRQPEAK